MSFSSPLYRFHGNVPFPSLFTSPSHSPTLEITNPSNEMCEISSRFFSPFMAVMLSQHFPTPLTFFPLTPPTSEKKTSRSFFTSHSTFQGGVARHAPERSTCSWPRFPFSDAFSPCAFLVCCCFVENPEKEKKRGNTKTKATNGNFSPKRQRKITEIAKLNKET